ncbi:MAG: sigma-70 family RNA polymerase sigma factor [Sandaracinaceae bacterium]
MSAASDDEFIREHTEMVRRIALRIRAQLDLRVDLDDLMAYGFSGLVEARQRFDPTRGAQFTTFAYYRVRGAILDGVRTMAFLPRRAHAQRRAAEALDRVAEEEAAARQADPDAKRDAEAALEAIDRILGRTCAAYVISVVGQDDDNAASSPEERLLGTEDRERVRAALDVLDDRERKLVVGYFYLDRTLEEMGAEMGVSKSWASRLCSRALGRLREALGSMEPLAPE